MKDRCYTTRPATLVELKTEINRIFEESDVAMLELVIRNFLTRLEKVIQMDAGHISCIKFSFVIFCHKFDSLLRILWLFLSRTSFLKDPVCKIP